MYRLRRVGRKERRFLGVCGGISKYIDREMDPAIIRILWVILSLFAPFMVLFYFVLALTLRSEDEDLEESSTQTENESKS